MPLELAIPSCAGVTPLTFVVKYFENSVALVLQTTLIAIRRMQSPTAIGRIPPSFLHRATSRDEQSKLFVLSGPAPLVFWFLFFSSPAQLLSGSQTPCMAPPLTENSISDHPVDEHIRIHVQV